MTDQTLESLRQEAEARREAIGRDVELVTDRVAPGRIADRQKAKLGERIGGVRNSVFGAKDSPTGARDDSSSGTSDLADRASGVVDQLKEASPDSVEDFTQGNPLAAGLIGLGVGLLAATLIPTTKEEQQVADNVQGKVDAAALQMAESGQQAAENLKPAVESATQAVKESAQDSVENVKGEAQSAADDVQATAKSEAQDVRSDN